MGDSEEKHNGDQRMAGEDLRAKAPGPWYYFARRREAGGGGGRRGQDGRGASTSSTWPAVQHSE